MAWFSISSDLPLLLYFFYSFSSLYSSILVYQVVKYFGLYISTWEYCFRRWKRTLSLVSKGESWLCCVWTCCHPHLPTVVRDCFLKWEWVGDESEPQATSACGGCFCFYMKDFRITACASWCNWFHHFFFSSFSSWSETWPSRCGVWKV